MGHQGRKVAVHGQKIPVGENGVQITYMMRQHRPRILGQANGRFQLGAICGNLKVRKACWQCQRPGCLASCTAKNHRGQGSGLNNTIVHPARYRTVMNKKAVSDMSEPGKGLIVIHDLWLITGISGGHYQWALDFFCQ